MAISLYEASIPSYLQVLGAVGDFLDKAQKHFGEAGIDPAEIVETRLFPDMHPFRYQVQSVVAHSKGAIEAMQNGVLKFWSDRPAHDYAGLQALIAETRGALANIEPADIDALAGRDVLFELPSLKRTFTTEGFLLSFSL